MKGLITYDMAWLARQKNLLLVLLALVIFYLVSGNAVLLLSLMPALAVVILSKTITLFLRPEVSRFLFTLPFSRREFLREKYLMILGGSLLISLVLALVTLGSGTLPAMECLTGFAVSALFILLFGSLLIPVTIKAGDDLQIWMFILSFGIAAVFIWASESLMGVLPAMIGFVQTHQLALGAGLAGICGLALFLSWKISLSLISRMEF